MKILFLALALLVVGSAMSCLAVDPAQAVGVRIDPDGAP
jgi:hypothetical protein